MYFSASKRTVLSFEYFISKKILKKEIEGKKVSRPIIRISVISITLAVVVNLITIAVVTGFQNEVREKVLGFGSHITITNAGENNLYESEPIRKNQAFFSYLTQIPEVKSVFPVAYKPVIFQSKKESRLIKLASGKDTNMIKQDIQGAILKGVNHLYDLSFFKNHLIKGRLPNFAKKTDNPEILLSKKTANALNYQINDTITAFFVKSQPLKRSFKLVGIYETGLDEFDKKIAISAIQIVQELNDWGLKAAIRLADTLSNGQLIVKAEISGGSGNFKYDWGQGFDRYSGFTICPQEDTTIRLIVQDHSIDVKGNVIPVGQADTAYLDINIKGTGPTYCSFQKNEEGSIQTNSLSEDGNQFTIQADHKKLLFHQRDSKGSNLNYVGGFEINIKDWKNLTQTFEKIRRKIGLIPNEHQETFKVQSILENQPDIFVWLGFLDLNILIILVLMILIGIINMGSALLVLILVRSNFIGILKSMGANDWSIRKIFLIQAGFLILRGLIFGNIIGLGLCALQYYFGWFTLNPEVYYLNRVPIELPFLSWLALNLGTLIVCIVALIVPSMAITRISPSKAIRFN